jgi:Protein of unknown function (DUF3604)
MQKLDLGHARITPKKPVVAGSHITATYTYTAGHPVDDTGCVKIAFRFAGDFGIPQFEDMAAANYCAISTTGDCRIEPRWDMKGHTRPWGRTLVLKVMSGYLARGDKIVVVFGERSGGSPGWQAQSFCEQSFEFKTLVDPIATYEFKELPESPVLRIVAGAPAKIVCIAPSRVQPGKPFTYFVKTEDRWGNPVSKPKRMRHSGFDGSGVHRIKIKRAGKCAAAISNPIIVSAEARAHQMLWADLHGQSEETIGSNSIDDYFVFARDYALLDAGAHQGNDFQITDAFWETVNETTRRFNKPGKFVTFPGFEWSGNTPLGGDRNVYYRSEGGVISRSCCDLLPGKTSQYKDSPTAAHLFRNLKGDGPFCFAHVGGRYADMDMHDAKKEVAVEIHSAWGSFEWLADDAFERGYRIGICANSDDHKGRPGASYPGARKFGSYGGLTCILAEAHDRENVHRAIQARHFYATTGNRALLDVSLDLGNGRQAIMGDVARLGKARPVLKVQFSGTAPVERLEVRNGTGLLKTWRPYAKDDLGRRIRIVWSGAEVRGRARHAAWDGRLTVRGNTIMDVTPVNFWNPDHMPKRIGRNGVAWESITTGGLAGLILTLKDSARGTVTIETEQKRLSRAIKAIGLSPRTMKCGGVRKQIQLSRLPEKGRTQQDVAFELPLGQLKSGDNPIYVCAVQEDGHMAWSSPIYLVS